LVVSHDATVSASIVLAPLQLTAPKTLTLAVFGQTPPAGALHEHAVHPVGATIVVPPWSATVGQPASLHVGCAEPVSSAMGPCHPEGTTTHVPPPVQAPPLLLEALEELLLEELLLEELLLEELLLEELLVEDVLTPLDDELEDELPLVLPDDAPPPAALLLAVADELGAPPLPEVLEATTPPVPLLA
jgi:hypothetical protein